MHRPPLRLLFVVALLASMPWLPRPSRAQTLLVANKSDDTVDLIDLVSRRSKATLPTGPAPHEIESSADGSLAVVSNYGSRETPGSSLTVIAVPTAEVKRTIDLGDHTRPHGLAWIDGDRIAVTTEGSAHLLVVEVTSGRIAEQVATDQEISHMVAVTPDGGRAFVANIGSGSVTAIDLTTASKLTDIATGDGAEGIAITPDGTEVWVTNRAADTLTIIDSRSLHILATVTCKGFPIRVAMTPDGSRALVSVARTGEVVVFDVDRRLETSRRQLDLSTVPDASNRLFGDSFGESPVPVGLVVDPTADRAWVAATQADAVVVIDTADLAAVDLLRAGREPDGMAYSSLSVSVER